MATLTTANSVLVLTVKGLYDIPVPIQGYATDDAFATEDLTIAETVMGVDAKLSGGYSPNPRTLTISLQADSVSNDIFDVWIGASDKKKEVYRCFVDIVLSGTGETYNFTNGILTKVSIMPEAKKMLQPRKYIIDFEDCTKGPV